MVMALEDYKYLKVATEHLDEAIDYLIYHPEGITRRYPHCVDDDNWKKAVAMEIQDDNNFYKWFNDYTLDGIVAVRECLAMTSEKWIEGKWDIISSGTVRVGPGLELNTDDSIEFYVSFGTNNTTS